MIDAAASGQIKAMYIVGEDPPTQIQKQLHREAPGTWISWWFRTSS
jgi:predicted molibdopterin-dependent oxidoreductase YjgC